MSTKIWIAWKISLDRLVEAKDWLHEYMFEEAVKFFMKLVKPNPEDKTGIRTFVEMLNILTEIGKSPSYDRSFLDLEAGFSFWIKEEEAFLIPFGMKTFIPTDNEVPEWFIDYHYQDQTDRPEDITEEEYEQRRKTWEEVAIGAPDRWNRGRFQHTVVSNESPYLSHLSTIVAERINSEEEE